MAYLILNNPTLLVFPLVLNQSTCIGEEEEREPKTDRGLIEGSHCEQSRNGWT